MRNWNLRFDWRGPERERASRLPMRNWNSNAWQRDRQERTWLPDYLWGIETYACLVPRRFSGFQTTYEELKQRKGRNLGGLERRRFQTTYEELKPIETKSGTTVYVASRLPMRNWNKASLKRRYSFALPDYLWGIETRQLNWWRGNLRLPDYPWGIETSTTKVMLRKMLASRLPMRNWNRLERNSPISVSRFQTTYEELKLKAAGLSMPVVTVASRLPMRNWNPNGTWGDAADIRLPDYLWGIETKADHLESSNPPKLPDYLWGIETFPCRLWRS